MEEIRDVTCGSFRNFIKRGVKIKKIIVILNTFVSLSINFVKNL